MTNDLVMKYSALFEQFESDYYNYRDGLVSFLSRPDITESVLEELVADFKRRRGTSDDGYMSKDTDWFVMYVEAFERRGTIRADHSPEDRRKFREYCKKTRRNDLMERYPEIYE